MGRHIYSSDFSAYGYVGAAIEKFDLAGLKTLLEQYQERDLEHEKRDLHSVTRGKSLFDLALDNIAYAKNDEQRASAFAIIETLIGNAGFDIDILDKAGDGHTPLSHVLDLYRKNMDNKEITEALAKFAKQICAKTTNLQNLSLLKETLGEQAIIPILPDINKAATDKGDSLLHIAANQGDDELVALILKTPDLNLDLELKNSNGRTALKEAMLEDNYGVATQLVKAGAKLDFDLGIEQTVKGWIKNSIKTERADPLESACMDGEVALPLAKAIIASEQYINPQRDTFSIIYNSQISEQILPEFLKRAATTNAISYEDFKTILEDACVKERIPEALALLEFFIKKEGQLEGFEVNINNLISPDHIGQVFRNAYKGNKQNAESYQQVWGQLLATNVIDFTQQIVTEPGRLKHTYKSIQQAIIETNDYKLYQQLFNHPKFSFAQLKEEEKFEITRHITSLPYEDFEELMDRFLVGDNSKNLRDFIGVVTQELIHQDKDDYLSYLQARKVIPEEMEIFKKQDAISLYKRGNTNILKELLSKKIDLDKVDERGNSLLHLAAANGHKELALELIRQGASLQEKNADGLTPLTILSMSKHKHNQAIAKAITHDAKFDLAKERVKIPTGQQHNPGDLPQVLLAYMEGNVDIAHMILGQLDQTSQGVEEHKIIIQKAFITAYLNADVKLVKTILNNNSDLNINRITNKEDTAKVIQPIFAIYELYKASDEELKARYSEIIKAVINQQGFEINKPNIKGQPLLTLAVADGEIELVQLLLSQANVNPNIQDKETEENIAAVVYKKLQAVKQENKPENAEQLRNLANLFAAFLANSNTKANLNKDKAGKDLLMLAIEANDQTTFDKLMNKEPNLAVEQTDVAKNTALLHAYASGNAHFVNTLTRKNASIKVINDQGANVLMAACRGGNPQLIQSLLTDGSIFKDDMDINGNRAIHYLVHSDAEQSDSMDKALKILTEKSFDINAVNKDKQTALIVAVMRGDLTKVGALLDAGADVNLKDKDGNTALMYACMLDRSDIAQKILSNNQVDVNITNNDGINAYMLAAVRGNFNGMAEHWKGDPKLMQALINHGADPVFGSYYSGLGDKLKLTFAKAAGISLANQLVAKLMPIPPLVTNSIEMANTVNTAHNVYKNVSSSTENMIREFFNQGTERAVKIDLANTYTGYHIGRFGIVTYGEHMKTLLGKHNFFEHADHGLYNANDVKEWSGRNAGDIAKQQELYKNLTAQYFNIQKQLQGYLWPWTRNALNNVAHDIETASGHLLNLYKNPNNEGKFSEKFAGFAEMINPKNRDKFIVYMLEHPELTDKYNLLLDAIIKDEILVSPKIYSDAIQFKNRMNELASQKENPDIVRKIIGFTTGRKLDQVGRDKVDQLNSKIEDNLGDFKTLREKVKIEAKVGELQNNSPGPTTFKEQTLKLVAGVIGKDAGTLVEGMAAVGGQVGGVVSGVAVAAAMEPAKARLIYDVAKDGLSLGTKAVSVGYAAGNVAAASSVAATVGTVIGTAALASTALYVLYQGSQKVADQWRKNAEFAAAIPKTIEEVYGNNVSLTHIKLFTEDKINGLQVSAAKDIEAATTRLPPGLPVGVALLPTVASSGSALPVAVTEPNMKGADQVRLGSVAGSVKPIGIAQTPVSH